MSDPTINAQFIASDHGRLFSYFHAPEGAIVRTSAILLLCPGETEYQRSHRALHSLAQQLAKAGWPVLRFDYFGTGDSEGESGSGHLDLWVKDAKAAAAYLMERSGALHLQVVGLRFGAFVAARLSQVIPVLNCVLWDPPASGQDYINECRLLDLEIRRHDQLRKVKVPNLPHSIGIDECAGFPLTTVFKQQVEAFSWQDQEIGSQFCQIVRGHDASDAATSAFAAQGLPVHRVQEDAHWGRRLANGEALLAPKALKTILDIIGRPHRG